VCVCVSCFINDLVNCQNYILLWPKWKNEIRTRTLGAMILRGKKIKSSKTHLSSYYCVHHKSHMAWPEIWPVTRGMVGIAGSLLSPAHGIGWCGLADRRIVFQFPAEGIHSHLLQSVHNCSWGQQTSSSTGVGLLPCCGRGVKWLRTSFKWRGEVSVELYLHYPPSSDFKDNSVATGSFISYFCNYFRKLKKRVF
jgi:hypothetical protein